MIGAASQAATLRLEPAHPACLTGGQSLPLFFNPQRRRGAIFNKTTTGGPDGSDDGDGSSQGQRLSGGRFDGGEAEFIETAAEGGQTLMPVERGLDAEDVIDVASDLLRSYCALIERGHHQSTIAEAMLGATVNLFDLLDCGAELPMVLRALAQQIEHGDGPA